VSMSVPSAIMTASIGVRYLAKPSLACFILSAFWIRGLRDYSITC
jgi:hypothetical protein